MRVNFTGQRRDAATGLGFYNARYYDSEIGRFISADSIVPGASRADSFNRYAYVSNNPLKYTDPSGHCGSTDADAGIIRCSYVGPIDFVDDQWEIVYEPKNIANPIVDAVGTAGDFIEGAIDVGQTIYDVITDPAGVAGVISISQVHISGLHEPGETTQVIEYETGSLIDEVLPAPGFAAPGLPAFVEENRPTSLWVHEVFHKEMQAGNSVSWGIGYALTSNSVEMEGRAREAGAFFGSGREFHPVTGNLVWTGENSVWNGYIGGDPNDHAAFMSGP